MTDAGSANPKNDPAQAGHLAGLGHASRDKADAYLAAQTRLAELQSDNLLEQNAFELSHLRWQRFNDRMRGLLQAMAAIVALAVLAGIGLVLWNAGKADGLVIEAFSVPPDFAAKGLTGDVVASKILDRLSAFQAETNSNRAPSSYANNWGDDIKVQIPDTGVSIGELNRYLHQWLGHETTIAGEIYHSTAGIAVTARVGAEPSPTFTGSEADLDTLIEKAAENVYRATQPYRYAVYLSQHGRDREAHAAYERLIASGPPLERGWACIGLGDWLNGHGEMRAAASSARHAIAARPDLLLGYNNLAQYENNLGHDSQALAASQAFLLHAKDGDASMGKSDFQNNLLVARENVAVSLGDFREALRLFRVALDSPDFAASRENTRNSAIQACAEMHDSACMSSMRAALVPSTVPQVMLSRRATVQISDIWLERWREVLALEPAVTGMLRKLGPVGAFFIPEAEDPVVAQAAAELGDFKHAHALIGETPLDNATGLRVRGIIRALEHKWPQADYWFARAVAFAPDVPFGDTEWGRALLAKGDADGAIAHFKAANKIGPHFADPLELWGEALIAKNRSDLAVAKFAEADRYAPHWGRLHLEWGKALLWSGDKQAAQKQFAVAAHLDLNAQERTALLHLQHA